MHGWGPQAEVPRLGRRWGFRMPEAHVLVVSFSPDASHLLSSLKEFCPHGSTVTLLCE
jgi:hypothetical protein